MSELHFDELDDKVIKLMNEAGITPVKGAYSFNAAINRLVAAVRADEREACAALVEADGRVHPKAPDAIWAKTVAKLIRARVRNEST